MRFLPIALLASILLLGSALPAAAEPGRSLLAGGETLELRGGDGTAVVAARGAILGQLDRGRIVITDRRSGPETEIRVWGADEKVERNGITTVYRGTDLGFRVLRGSWRVLVHGTGIDVTAAGRGFVSLRGEAGEVSVDGAPWEPWPADAFLSLFFGE